MRLPNGFGQITEVRGRNLRKPFRVMVPVGKTNEGKFIARPLRPVSYFETYNEAYQALTKYHAHPFDLSNNTTMQELFDAWIANKIGKVDSSTLARYRTAWSYSASIHDMLVRDVHISDMRNCIENGTITIAGRVQSPKNNSINSMKTLYNLLFDYAVSLELVDKNYARLFNVESGYVPNPACHMA